MWSSLYLTFMKLTFTAAEELPEQGQRAFNRIASSSGNHDFERNWGLSSLNLKASALSIGKQRLIMGKADI
jgi:hypothetical protein